MNPATLPTLATFRRAGSAVLATLVLSAGAALVVASGHGTADGAPGTSGPTSTPQPGSPGGSPKPPPVFDWE